MKKPKPPPPLPPTINPSQPWPPSPLLTRSGTVALNAMTQGIRNKVSDQRFEIAKTIAELNAWRDEIDATIAFLKAQRGDSK